MSLIVAAVLLLAGCDESLDPFENETGDQFAIHGYLDTSVDSQVVRVEELRPAILADEIDLSDLIVTTRVEPDGEVVQWTRDSIELLDGSMATVFRAVFRPVAGNTYSLNVRRPGRLGAQAVTRIPSQPGFVVTDPVNQVQTVFLSDLPRTPESVAVKYDVVVPEDNERQSVEIVYRGDSGVTSSSRRVDVRLKVDQTIVEGQLFRSDQDDPLTLERIGLVVRMSSEEFDTPSDEHITGGDGFFGSVAEFDLPWILESEIVTQIGFEDGQQAGKSH